MYYISDRGQVWSRYNEQMIKQQIVSGYKSVNIGYPKQLFKHVHRLVALIFIDNPNNCPIVNHKDGDKFNNVLTNLEWTTASENRQHAQDNLPRKNPERNEKSVAPLDSIELKWLKGYFITKQGTVYSTRTSRYLKLQLNNNGYHRVSVMIDGKNKLVYVHKLVAEAFLSSPILEQVNHKNLDRTDNRIENLEYCTTSQNNQHSIDNNPSQYKHLQKKVAQLDIKTCDIINVYNGLKEASRITGINSGSICKVCKGVKPTAGGYKWEYKTNDQ